jgi:hypothetical protein
MMFQDISGLAVNGHALTEADFSQRKYLNNVSKNAPEISVSDVVTHDVIPIGEPLGRRAGFHPHFL